jgi:prostaglandin-endoperoxide synthase 2
MSLIEEIIVRPIGKVIDGIAWLDGVVTHKVVNLAVGATRTRPHPWSTFAPYICWDGLTDRGYLGRHLPPRDLSPYPDIKAVMELFKRPTGVQTLSKKSTCLFPAFAQYLTDGFIRTLPTDPAQTTTNHEIDLCPLYGRTRAQTRALRELNHPEGKKGRLKTQSINGEDFAPFFFQADGCTPKPEFDELDYPLFSPSQPLRPKPPETRPDWVPLGRDKKPITPWPPTEPSVDTKTIFAFGGDRANSTPFTSMLNTLLLREHNRLAAGLEAQNPDWDDERVFQTARNITIVMFIKLVVEEYINHILPAPFGIGADPSVAWTANWNRPNRMTAEFSMLYRWHSLMPDTINWDGTTIGMDKFQLHNQPLLDVGLKNAFEIASAAATGQIGAFNTTDALLKIEALSISQARNNDLASYNDYRAAFGMERATSFEQISANPAVRAKLQALYDTPDKVEFYPGLFAEDTIHNGVLPSLLTSMVAVDAFSQALTNPLLSEHVWSRQPEGSGWPDAFTEWGRAEIARTHKLVDILGRNVLQPPTRPVEMTQATWHYGM